MSLQPRGSSGTIVGTIALSLAIVFAWALLLTGLSDTHGGGGGGDAADAGLGTLILTTLTILIWSGLGGLTLLAWLKGDMPSNAALVALTGLLISFFAALTSLELLEQPVVTPLPWTIVVPVGVPPLTIIFCFWALLPTIRHAFAPALTVGLVWGGTLLLCATMIPMWQARQAEITGRERDAVECRAKFAAVPNDAPLWAWTRFLATDDDQTNSDALGHIRGLDRRQEDAETMLARADFPPGKLDTFDLDPNASLCDKARLWLRTRAAALVQRTPGSRPYADIAETMGGALTDMKWLVGYGCSCDTEALAWEAMAKSYRDPDDLISRMAELRAPGALGKTRREYPAHFWMLDQNAALSAWLFYTYDAEVSQKAVAGARTLPHRTAEMIALLADRDSSKARNYLLYVPSLDLDATPALCAAATQVLRQYLADVARPDKANPQDYEALLTRLSYSPDFSVLIWLASHGCDVNTELTDAIDLIGAYQPSPEGQAMSVRLRALRRAS